MEKKQGELVQSVGLWSAVLLVVSSIVGSGVFKKIAPMSAELQSPVWVLVAWILAGVISLFGALSNAEVTGLLADSGGEYVYFRKMYGRFFAFMYGWACFAVIRSASIASIAYVFSQSFNNIFPLPATPENLAQLPLLGLHPLDNLSVKLLAIVVVWVLSFVNYRGLKFGEGFSNIITSLVLIGILGIVILGFTIGNGSLQNIQTNAVGYQSPDAGKLFTGLFAALIAAFWGYEGWSSVAYLGGEIKNPQRNIPLALFFGVMTVIALYLSVNFTYLYTLPIDKFVEIHKGENQIAAVAVVQSFLGNPGNLLISSLILIATFGCTNTTILLAARLYHKMANEGLFFKKADFIHPEYNTPSGSLWMQAFWTSVLILSGSFDQLTDMLIFAAFIFYGATAFGVFVLRRTMPDAPRPYKVVGYPFVPAIFVIFCVILIGMTLVNKTQEALWGLGLMLTGLPFYFIWNKKA
jgi:APA family basic amino acid/polyamine antiporter